MRPLHPLWPTIVGLGFARVLGPTRSGFANEGNSPPILMFLGAHPPDPLGRGLRPLHPLLPTLVGLGFARVLGPTRCGFANVGNSPPILMFLGAHPPDPLGGGLRPLHPLLPTLVGLGFASVLGPTRSGVANVGNSPPFKVSRGDPPRPLDPSLPTLVGLGFAGVLAPTRGEIAPSLAGLGFASVLGPTRGGVTGVSCSLLL